MQIDIRVLELLSSKLCHDLISPVSAINNGVELIEDIGDPVVNEAMKLIGDSASLASRRLRLFRLAYGRAGSEENLPLQDVKPIIESYFAGGKIALNWANGAVSGKATSLRGCMKAMINLLMLGEEILAYGGSIVLRQPEESDGQILIMEIVGRAAQLSPLLQAALEGATPIDEITPRSVQAYVSGQFVAHFGLQVRHIQPYPDRLDLILIQPQS
ncbi:MAG: histidine phosphotransferase family protein [Alphaproteobacteria bacterium]|nr:histidine phosphotransferase family protein [Alphaproteobacteria bacterium]